MTDYQKKNWKCAAHNLRKTKKNFELVSWEIDTIRICFYYISITQIEFNTKQFLINTEDFNAGAAAEPAIVGWAHYEPKTVCFEAVNEAFGSLF